MDPAGFSEHGIPTEGEAGCLSARLICEVGEGVMAGLGRAPGKFRMVTAHRDIEALVRKWKNEYARLGYGTDLLPALEDFCGVTGIKAVQP